MRIPLFLMLTCSLLPGCSGNPTASELQQRESLPVDEKTFDNPPPASPKAPTAKETQDDVWVAIEKLGGKITFDDTIPGRPVNKVLIGNDAALVHLKGLSNLQSLTLETTQVTDAGLEHLKGLTNLEILFLRGTQVTDAGLVHLKGLANLETLALSHNVTDAGLVHLKGLMNLKELVLDTPKLTDAGLIHLKELKNLRELRLKGTTQLTDVGLEHLKGLTNLESLYLHSFKVTDAGLVHLKALTNLQSLNLRYTNLTATAVKDLQAALPNCEIIR